MPRNQMTLSLLDTELYTSDTWDYPNLSAPFWRINWKPEATGFIETEKKRYTFGPDKLFLIAPNTRYRGLAKARPTQVYFHFLVEPGFLWPGDGVFERKLDNREVQALLEFRDELCRENRDTLLALKTYTFVVEQFSLFAQQYSLRPRRHSLRIEEVIRTMELNLHRCLTNELLADSIHMATNAFARLFREEVGISPQKFHLQLRLNRSALELHYTKKSIDEVADEFGFTDRSHFSKRFTVFHGCSPASFRKRMKHSLLSE